MKSFRKSNSSGHQKNNVDNVFVCVENAGRCQMAEGFFTKYYEGYEPFRAGTRPVSSINSVVMKKVELDISKQKSRY
jgi:protein-tyrosine-phosphatase